MKVVLAGGVLACSLATAIAAAQSADTRVQAHVSAAKAAAGADFAGVFNPPDTSSSTE